MKDTITKRQFIAVAFVGLLSPLIRRFPRVLAAEAGRSAWLAVLLAIPLLALAILGWGLLYRGRPAGTGFHGLLAYILGPVPGKAVTLVYSLWFVLHAGFLLRTGANRFSSLIYPEALPGIFTLGMALGCALVAAGPLKALGRCAMLLRPLMAAVPVLVFLLTVQDADFGLLLPVTAAGLVPDGLAAARVANLFGVAAYLGFCGDRISDGCFRLRDYGGWVAAAMGLLLLITLGCLGMFGPELTAKMSYPFFMLTRDVSVLGALERVEPVTVALWVFSDFLLISALLWMAGQNVRTCLSLPAGARWPGCAGGVLAAGAAFLIPSELEIFSLLSDLVMPLGCALFAFGLPLLLLLIKALRRL